MTNGQGYGGGAYYFCKNGLRMVKTTNYLKAKKLARSGYTIYYCRNDGASKRDITLEVINIK